MLRALYQKGAVIDHHMGLVCRALRQALVIGFDIGARPAWDVDIEPAKQEVADDDIGGSQGVSGDEFAVFELRIKDVEL